MKKLKIAMLGFGNAGRAFSKIILEKRKEIMDSLGWEFSVVAVSTASRGSLVDECGIDLAKALDAVSRFGHFDEEWEEFSRLSSKEIIEKVDYDVLIEITPLNIFSGQPAIDHIEHALIRKKHVITANKGPLAWAYKELRTLALKQGVIFLHETTVMDGTPVFNLVDETLPMCRVVGFEGILNTTTNFILEEMAEGKSFDEAVIEGRKRGFVEADPSMDIEGWDAAAKTAALINVLMDGRITPSEIEREGIENITYTDIEKAQKNNKVIKLICQGSIEGGRIVGRVKPVLIERDHIYAGIKGTSSVLSLKTDLMGDVTIVEHNPEIEQTGYGIFSDLLRLVKKL